MLTLTQLYDLGQNEGINIFDGLQLPSDSPLDRETLINSIIMRCGLNFPNFADPFVMASAVTVWSAKNQYTFKHVAKIYEASYSPIENYDRYEDMNTDHNRTMKDDTKSNNNKVEKVDLSNNVKEDRTTTHSGTDTTTDETKTSAYDDSTYIPENKSTSDLKHGESISEEGDTNTTNNTSKNTNSSGSVNKGVNENEKTIQKNHIRGNIGVTTADAMQKEEYELLNKYNPYEFIAGLFENDLTLFVY